MKQNYQTENLQYVQTICVGKFIFFKSIPIKEKENMKLKKFKDHLISNRMPEVGDTMICIQRKSVNFGLTTKVKGGLDYSDTKNWKVIIQEEERKQQLVDAVIKDLKKGFKVGDYTVLDELLKFIPAKNLVQALPEEQWTDFKDIK